MANFRRMALVGGAGLALFIVARTPLRRAGTAIVVARTVWKDPRVQKLRQRVEKKIEKRMVKK